MAGAMETRERGWEAGSQEDNEEEDDMMRNGFVYVLVMLFIKYVSDKYAREMTFVLAWNAIGTNRCEN